MLEIGPPRFFWKHAPRPDFKVSLLYVGWLAFQTTLYQTLPSKERTGQLTPDGNLLQYRTNGLTAWVLTHFLFAAWVLHGCVDPAIIAKNWEPLLISVNVYGFLLSGVAYVKALVSPSHDGDRKFSGELRLFTSVRRLTDGRVSHLRPLYGRRAQPQAWEILRFQALP